MIISSGKFVYLVHHFLNDSGRFVVIFIGGFLILEVNIGVLRGTLLNGVFGVERAFLEIFYIFHIDELFHFVVIESVYLLNFVAGSEPVKEVQERNF